MTDASRDQVSKLVAMLRSDQAGTRVAVLQTLLVSPRLEPPVVEAIEALLADRQVAILSIPYSYGEIRYLAAEALAASRAAARRMADVVILDPGYRSLSPRRLSEMVSAADPGVRRLGHLEQYAWLRDHGRLEAKRLEFDPRMYDPAL
jgi:hypothetical protein